MVGWNLGFLKKWLLSRLQNSGDKILVCHTVVWKVVSKPCVLKIWLKSTGPGSASHVPMMQNEILHVPLIFLWRILMQNKTIQCNLCWCKTKWYNAVHVGAKQIHVGAKQNDTMQFMMLIQNNNDTMQLILMQNKMIQCNSCTCMVFFFFLSKNLDAKRT